MTRTVIASEHLFLTNDTSDKEYKVHLIQVPEGFLVDIEYGKRGSKLRPATKTAAPIDEAAARKAYDKILKGQLADGYTRDSAGVAFAGGASEARVSGFLPQLLNALPEENSQKHLDDDDWVLQKKEDGERALMQYAAGALRQCNRLGLWVDCDALWLEQLQAWAPKSGAPRSFVLDGEHLVKEGRFHAFDILELDGVSLRELPLIKRMQALSELSQTPQWPSDFHLVETFQGAKAKNQAAKDLKASKAEGYTLKRKDAPYTPNRPASGGPALKVKFYETATFQVVRHSADRRSVTIGAFDAQSKTIELGAVTIPPNEPMPATGSLIEVRYQYRHWEGDLSQPVYLMPRKDLKLEAAQLSQITRVKAQAIPRAAAAPKPKRKANV